MSPAAPLDTHGLLAAIQCPKRLWLDHQPRPGAREEPPGTLLDAVEGARELEAVARQRWPDAVMVRAGEGAKAIRLTRAAVARRSVPAVFGARFLLQGLPVRVDLLLRAPGSGWDVVTIKAAASVRPGHDAPLAIQVAAVREAGLQVRQAGVLFPDTTYVRGEDGLDAVALLRFEDRLGAVEARVAGLRAEIAAARLVLAGSDAPEVATGPHCTWPRTCPYLDTCAPRPGAYAISRLPRSEKLAATLAARGITDLRELPAGTRLSAAQARARDCILTGRPYLSPELVAALREAPHPRHFLDFESASFVVPRYPGTRPFAPLPTQWSLHTQHTDGRLTHTDFLHDADTDPREPFLRSLLAALGEAGCVVVYSDYEATLLRALAAHLPTHAAAVAGVIDRMVDLLRWLRAGYDHPALAGRHSIKRVLPVLVPGMGYADLPVHDGQEAARVYRRLLDPTLPAGARAELRAGLRAYCARDTLAMVRVWAALAGGG